MNMAMVKNQSWILLTAVLSTIAQGATFTDSHENGLGGLLRPRTSISMSSSNTGDGSQRLFGLETPSEYDGAGGGHVRHQSWAPFFARNETETEPVTAQLGTNVALNCTVENLEDKTVSWLRRNGNETHLLTVGLNMYIRDSRISITYVLHNNWQLRIQHVQTTDAGVYQCEISTHPPIHREVSVQVVVPQVIVIDEHGGELTEKFYKTGSTIELKCIVKEVPPEEAFVTWTHKSRQLNYDTSRGGISVKTESTHDGTVSRLYLANAGSSDSGNYTCSVSDLASSSVFVNVLAGEQPGALHVGAASHFASCFKTLMSTMTSTFIFIWFAAR